MTTSKTLIEKLDGIKSKGGSHYGRDCVIDECIAILRAHFADTAVVEGAARALAKQYGYKYDARTSGQFDRDAQAAIKSLIGE